MNHICTNKLMVIICIKGSKFLMKFFHLLLSFASAATSASTFDDGHNKPSFLHREVLLLKRDKVLFDFFFCALSGSVFLSLILDVFSVSGTIVIDFASASNSLGWFSSFLFCFKISTLFAYRLIFSISSLFISSGSVDFLSVFSVFLFLCFRQFIRFPFLIVFSKSSVFL